MLQMYITLMLAFLISLILMALSMTLSKKEKSQEKLSPFECGFDLIHNMRNPFSMSFFLIAILFLIFDIEIAIFLPIIINLTNTKKIFWMISTILFIVILIWGLIHEWLLSSLNWKD